jgi:hypothetical protein
MGDTLHTGGEAPSHGKPTSVQRGWLDRWAFLKRRFFGSVEALLWLLVALEGFFRSPFEERFLTLAMLFVIQASRTARHIQRGAKALRKISKNWITSEEETDNSVGLN